MDSLLHRWWIVLIAGLTVGVLGGCGGTVSANLKCPGGRAIAEMQSGIGPGQSQSDGEVVVCLDRPGAVHVEAVHPVGATGGMHVQAFVLQKSPWMAGPGHSSIGEAFNTLKQADVLKKNVSNLTLVCNDKTGTGYVVDLQMAYTRGRVGHADGFEVDYVSGGQHKKMFLPLAFTLCAGGMHDAACGRVDSQLHPVSQLAKEAAAQH